MVDSSSSLIGASRASLLGSRVFLLVGNAIGFAFAAYISVQFKRAIVIDYIAVSLIRHRPKSFINCVVDRHSLVSRPHGNRNIIAKARIHAQDATLLSPGLGLCFRSPLCRHGYCVKYGQELNPSVWRKWA